MEKSEAKELVETFHRDRMRNDPETTLAYFTEDARFSIAGQPMEHSIAVATEPGEIRAIADALVSTWEWRGVEFKNIIADGDVIVARYILTVRHVPSDQTITTEIVDFLQIRDGKIAEMREFVDTAYAGAIAQQA